jgi:hypothetical protein
LQLSVIDVQRCHGRHEGEDQLGRQRSSVPSMRSMNARLMSVTR